MYALTSTHLKTVQACEKYFKRLATMDILVLATMKNAAKCDTSCELQNPVNHQMFERRWRLGEVPRQVLMSVGSKYQASP
jgi:hypothetical protein